MNKTSKFLAGLVSGAVIFAIPLAAEDGVKSAQAGTSPYPTKNYPAQHDRPNVLNPDRESTDAQYRASLDAEGELSSAQDAPRSEANQGQLRANQARADAAIAAGELVENNRARETRSEARRSRVGLGAHGPDGDLPHTDGQIADSTLRQRQPPRSSSAAEPYENLTPQERDTIAAAAYGPGGPGAQDLPGQSEDELARSRMERLERDRYVALDEGQQRNLIPVSTVVGSDVRGPDGVSLGQVSDIAVAINGTGSPDTYLVVSRGGVFGIGASQHFIPASQVQYDAGEGRYNTELDVAEVDAMQTAPAGGQLLTFSQIEDVQISGPNGEIGEVQDVLVRNDGRVYLLADPADETLAAGNRQWALPAEAITDFSDEETLYTDVALQLNASSGTPNGWVSVREENELFVITPTGDAVAAFEDE